MVSPARGFSNLLITACIRDVMGAIGFATAKASDARVGIDVINLSLGHPNHAPSSAALLVRPIEPAARAGAIVVASDRVFGTDPETGEIGYAGTTSPGNAPAAITVGAFDHHGTIAGQDERDASYDIVWGNTVGATGGGLR